VGFPAPAGAYRPADEWLAVLEAAAAAEARRGVVVETIGETVEGRPIRAFHVPSTGEERHRVLVLAGLHAYEWITLETAGQLVLDLLVAPEPHARVTVVPVVNLDERLASEDDLRAGSRAYHRENAVGIDLNRDFAVNHEPVGVWSRVLPGYAASSPRALSQPETRAIDALARRERFDRAASLHAFGGYVYWPWSGRWGRPPDWEGLATLGRAMEAAQGRHAYRSRQLSRWGFFFRAHGSEIDHLYGRYGVRAYLVELTRSGLDPLHLRRTMRHPFHWYNPVDPRPHVGRGVAAVRALLAAEP
jgi:hypothetical protein